MSSTAYNPVYPCGDHAVTAVLGEGIEEAVSNKVISLFEHLRSLSLTGIKDIIPAYNTLMVVYDPAMIAKNGAASVSEKMCRWLQQEIGNCQSRTIKTQKKNIPVCYHESLAPDIVSLAALHNIGVEEVISLHTGKSYRVYMLGFLPGFAYMGSVPEKLVTPRKSSPRSKVPAGSVGIAGEQTGIYPFESPGGWQLIGQTPLQMFDANREMPAYLQPGDEVIFQAISLSEFNEIKQHEYPHT